MKIGFLVGDLANISGGSNAIIEYATGLAALGHDVTILSTSFGPVGGADWHPGLGSLSVRSVNEARSERFDFAFATWWLTFFDLGKVASRVYGYFNQSLESRFHDEPVLKELNRRTYAFPVLFVTEARWLAEFIDMVQPRGRVVCVPNGLSRKLFPRVDHPPAREGPLRVLVEGPWGVPFKGVADTFQVLEEAHALGVPMEVGWLASDSRGARPQVGGRGVQLHERVPMDEVRRVLARYDILLKLSRVEGMFGPPLEMFSQGGTAICCTVTGSDEYMVHGWNGLLVEPHNRAQIPRYLELLERSPEHLAALRRNAVATARAWPGWEESTRELSARLEELRSEGYENAELRPALCELEAERARALARTLTLGDRVKASSVYNAAKRLVPATARVRLKSLIARVLE
jgi:glycosyltransferase involved in cell wall biosynthesis